MTRSHFFSSAAVALTVLAGTAYAQPGSDVPRTMPPRLDVFNPNHVPQPHLAVARAIAAEEDGWRHPGLFTCYPGADDGAINSTERFPPPTKVFDNLVFLGENLLSPYALDTSGGIILFDAMDNEEEVEQFIIGGLRKVGLDPARIKVLVISHEHGDHFGGARYLQDKYGVKVYASDIAWDAIDRPASGRNPNQPPAQNVPPQQRRLPPKRDVALKDGDTITLGDTTIKVFVTPGHTAGAISMLIPVKDHGQPHLIAYFGGAAPGQSDALKAAFDRSWGRLGQIVTDSKAEGFISNHTRYDDSVYKLELGRARPNNPNPFLVGTADTVRFTKEIKECALNSADIARARQK